MLLHGDIFLNKGTKPLVGVGDLDWGIICHFMIILLCT